MKNRDLVIKSLLSSLGVLVYTSLVATLMFNASKVFGMVSSLLIPVFLLLLFIVSACITGALVLGYPIVLFLNGQKKQAIKFFAAVLAWLLLYVLVIVSYFLLK